MDENLKSVVLERARVVMHMMDLAEGAVVEGAVDLGTFGAVWSELRATAFLAGWIETRDFVGFAVCLSLVRASGRSGYAMPIALATLPPECATFTLTSYEKSSHASVQVGDFVVSEFSKVDASMAVARAAVRARIIMMEKKP